MQHMIFSLGRFAYRQKSSRFWPLSRATCFQQETSLNQFFSFLDYISVKILCDPHGYLWDNATTKKDQI